MLVKGAPGCFVLFSLLKQSGGFPGDETFSHGDDSTDAWVHTLIGNQSQQENRVKELMDLLRQRNYTFGKMPSTPDGKDGFIAVTKLHFRQNSVNPGKNKFIAVSKLYFR